MDLDPAHLRSFDAVVRHGGYHRAAEALHLTQPAVSRHIRRLEQQLGEPLFRKRGRGVELTAFGGRAEEELSNVLQAHDRALARLLREGQAPFAFGVVDNLSEPLLPALLAVLRGYLGARELRLRVDRSRTLTESFGRGELDAALVMDPYGSPHAAALGELTLRWWTAANVDPPLTLPAQVPLVAYEPPCSFRELAIGRIRQLGSEAAITAEAPHLSGVATAARNGLGLRAAAVRRRRPAGGLARAARRDVAGAAVAVGRLRRTPSWPCRCGPRCPRRSRRRSGG